MERVNSTSSTNLVTFKIVVIGDISVGKTNIIRRILGDEFVPTQATIGVDFASIKCSIADDNDPWKNIDLSWQIWDTSGAERFRAITISHIRNANGAFIVYDITNSESFNSVKYWHNHIKMSANDDIIIYLLGNKTDWKYKNAIDPWWAQDFVLNEKIHKFRECSAKTNEGIMSTFKEFYTEIYRKNKNKIIESRNKNKKLFEVIRKGNESNCC